jgi:uncharacterized protein (DUF1501 family)
VADENKAPCDACIVLWMNGGPSHIDTFDPKPGQKSAGPFKAIPTSAKGILIGEHLPRVAEEAHRLAIVRSVTSKEGSHERARQLAHTGHIPNPTVDPPAIGAWVSARRGNGASSLPDFVSLAGPSGGGGFLGHAHAPLVVQTPGQAPEDVAYGPGVTEGRFDRRQAALSAMEGSFEKAGGGEVVAERRAVMAAALRMMRSPRLSAFKVDDEPAAVRAAYGETPFGRGCLVARRLVEAGVKFVELTLDGWDTHEDNFGRVKTLCGTLDPAMSTLVRELAQRGLLERTLVVCMGEFGRTPRINGRDGRDHFPAAWSAVLAGGPIRGGIAYGASDAEGASVVDRPVSVPDLLATIAFCMGLNPDETVTTPQGRPIAVTDGGAVVRGLLR